MPIPERIQIGPYVYRVSTDASGMDRARVAANDTHCVGTVTLSKGVISLDPDQSASCMRDTVLHEAMHAIRFVVGAPEDDEPFIRHMSAMLLDTLRRNPQLTAYLLEPDV